MFYISLMITVKKLPYLAHKLVLYQACFLQESGTSPVLSCIEHQQLHFAERLRSAHPALAW
jgi:hypothetical protein